MIRDKLLEFADELAIPTAAETALVGDVIDLQDSAYIGGESLYLLILIEASVTSAGAATVKFTLASDAQAAIATDGSATVHWESAAIGKATLVDGYQVAAVQLPLGTYERYLGILATVGTAALTAGKVTAYLTDKVPSWKVFPDAVP